MKKNFTKNKRHRYYKEALKTIRSNRGANICVALDIVSNIYCKNYPAMWPEFAAQKPYNKNWNMGWFPPTKIGQAKRVEILKKCISQTRSKS